MIADAWVGRRQHAEVAAAADAQNAYASRADGWMMRERQKRLHDGIDIVGIEPPGDQRGRRQIHHDDALTRQRHREVDELRVFAFIA
ncbi:MAG: hypothetical protein ACRENC_17090, partial [Gemmatimonadaceae bacterium]